MNKFSINQPFIPKTNVPPVKKQQVQTAGDLQRKFTQQLQEAMQEQQPVKFSHHAEVKMQRNGIVLSGEQLERMNDGIQKAKNKGANEAIMLMDNLAFVVSVKNDTVITAMQQNKMESQVVTNIDSAVIL
jgi:flagellar operon protein